MANIVYYEDIQLVDGVKGFFGTGEDLQIYHSSGTNIIDSTVGDLIVKVSQDDGDIIFQSDNGSGAIATYFRLDGGDVRTEFEEEARFLDSVEARWGTGGDLRLYHSGSNSFIQNFTGDLKLIQYATDGDIAFFSDDGSGGETEYFRVDGGQEKTLFIKNTEHQDSVKAQFGNSGDFSIFHDGTNSKIENDTGQLRIIQNVDDSDMLFQCDDGSGSVATYFKLDGGDGRTEFELDTLHQDSVKAGFGNDADLEIYHDGNNSFIEDAGNLYVRGSAIRLQGANLENMIYAAQDSGVYIYHNNVKKFETTSTGVGITGNADVSSNVLVGSADSYFGENVLRFKSAGAAYIDHNTVGQSLVFRTSDSSSLDTNALTITSAGYATFVQGIQATNTSFSGTMNIAGSIYHIGDTNTYFGFHGNDLWRVVTGGSERLEVSNSGVKLGNTGATVTQILDEDNMASDSATALATQQSIKAYVDSSTTGVLTYQGTWNASTNSPSLSSGSGTPGYYYIVSVAGSTNLDGITDWAVGDWAVFSDQATDAWQKIDNTAVGNVSGSGANNRLTLWSGTSTVDSDANFYMSGTTLYTPNLTTTGDITVGDDVFIADSGIINLGSGNDMILFHDGADGVIRNTTGHLYLDNLALNQDIYVRGNDAGSTITALRLDMSDAGWAHFNSGITVGAGTSTFAGRANFTTNLDTSISVVSTDGTTGITFTDDSGTGYIYYTGSEDKFYTDGKLAVNGNTLAANMEFQVNGDSTFTGIVLLPDGSAGSPSISNTGDTNTGMYWPADHQLGFAVNASRKLYISTTEAFFQNLSSGVSINAGGIDVTGNSSIQGSLSITGDGSNAATLTESGSGDFTIHSQDDLRLNTGGQDIVLQGDSSEFGRLTNSSQDFIIQNITSDKDIIFKGNDGGSTITALTLDMSGGGNAQFNAELYMPNYIYHTGDADTYFGFPTANEFKLVAGGNNIIAADANSAYLYYQGSAKLSTTNTGASITGGLTTSASSSIAGAQFTSNTSRNDNLKSIYGTDGDIEIYSDNTTAFMEITNVTNFVIGDSTQFNTANIAIARVGAQTGFKSMEEDWFGVYSDADTGKTHLTISGTEKLRTDSSGVVVTGNVILNGDSNIVLDTSVSSTQSSGTIIKIGSHMSALVAGNIYYAGNSMGNLYWYGADADSSSTENMLALSVGTDADVDGMLLNGIYHKASHGLTVGEPIYLSTTSMAMTNTAPSGNNDYVRVLGYAIDSNHIYFNPDNTWVKIST